MMAKILNTKTTKRHTKISLTNGIILDSYFATKLTLAATSTIYFQNFFVFEETYGATL